MTFYVPFQLECPYKSRLHLNIWVAHSFQKYDLVITYEISYPKMEQIMVELLLFLTDNQHHIKNFNRHEKEMFRLDGQA